MLTIDEIKNIAFRKSGMGGYRPDDVDEFIDDVIATFEQMKAEKADLLRKMDILATKIEQYRTDEETVRNALLASQKVSDQALKEAKDKATYIIKAAEKKSRKILTEAEMATEREKDKYEAVLAETAKLRKEMIIEEIQKAQEKNEPEINENNGDIEITVDTEDVDIDNADVNETEAEPSNKITVIAVETETNTPIPEDETEKSDLMDKDKVSFSVALPTTLALIVTDTGVVYSAGKAVILNNSTADVVISGFSVLSQGNWMLAPYTTNMSNVKVDSNLIGFAINGEETSAYGQEENFTLKKPWNIAARSSIPLAYSAVVSPFSSPIVSETVLSIMFIAKWAV